VNTSAPDLIRVAAAQYPVGSPTSFSDWRARQVHFVEEGVATGAALLVLPEYGLMDLAAAFGTRIAGDLTASLAAVADAREEVDAVFAELTRKHGVHLLAPSGPVRRDSRFVNAASLFVPSGAQGVAEKQIMTPFERNWGVSPGDRATVFETALGRIGIAICYDSEFPLLVRAMTEAGADLILIPSCTERLSGFHRVRAAAQARALESQVATVMSPTIGEAPWSPAIDVNRGAAGIFLPPERTLSETGLLEEGTLDAPGWIVGEIDFARLRAVRGEGEMRNAVDWSHQAGAAPLAENVRIVRVV